MKASGLLLTLLSANAGAATAYVTDELLLTVYSEPNAQGQRLATLKSGATVETLAVNGESTQVQLPDGKVGWVKSSYLTSHENSSARLKQAEEELDRLRAAAPASAEPALRAEVARLTRELAARTTEAAKAAAAAAVAVAPVAPAPAMPAPAPAPAMSALAQPAAPVDFNAEHTGNLWLEPRAGVWAAAVCVALGCGFWLGYATLARRIRQKFGGFKVY